MNDLDYLIMTVVVSLVGLAMCLVVTGYIELAMLLLFGAIVMPIGVLIDSWRSL